MRLWEFNACVRGFNRKQKDSARDLLASNWQTAALTGAAFAGKLKSLNHYMKNDVEPVKNKKKTPDKPDISIEDFEDKLRRAKRKEAR